MRRYPNIESLVVEEDHVWTPGSGPTQVFCRRAWLPATATRKEVEERSELLAQEVRRMVLWQAVFGEHWERPSPAGPPIYALSGFLSTVGRTPRASDRVAIESFGGPFVRVRVDDSRSAVTLFGFHELRFRHLPA